MKISESINSLVWNLTDNDYIREMRIQARHFLDELEGSLKDLPRDLLNRIPPVLMDNIIITDNIIRLAWNFVDKGKPKFAAAFSLQYYGYDNYVFMLILRDYQKPRNTKKYCYCSQSVSKTVLLSWSNKVFSFILHRLIEREELYDN